MKGDKDKMKFVKDAMKEDMKGEKRMKDMKGMKGKKKKKM